MKLILCMAHASFNGNSMKRIETIEAFSDKDYWFNALSCFRMLNQGRGSTGVQIMEVMKEFFEKLISVTAFHHGFEVIHQIHLYCIQPLLLFMREFTSAWKG